MTYLKKKTRKINKYIKNKNKRKNKKLKINILKNTTLNNVSKNIKNSFEKNKSTFHLIKLKTM